MDSNQEPIEDLGVQVLNPQTHFRHMAGAVRLVSGVTQRNFGRPTGVEPVTPGATVFPQPPLILQVGRTASANAPSPLL
jgi:hypothetical protein